MSATLAAFPELRVVRKLDIRHRAEAEFVVHLHYGRAGGNGEDLGIGEELSGKDKRLFLNAFGQAHTPEFVRYYKAGIGHELLSAPGFNLGESGKTAILRKSDDGLSVLHFIHDIFRRTLGDTGLALQGGKIDFLADFLGKHSVAFVGHFNCKFHL